MFYSSAGPEKLFSSNYSSLIHHHVSPPSSLSTFFTTTHWSNQKRGKQKTFTSNKKWKKWKKNTPFTKVLSEFVLWVKLNWCRQRFTEVENQERGYKVIFQKNYWQGAHDVIKNFKGKHTLLCFFFYFY